MVPEILNVYMDNSDQVDSASEMVDLFRGRERAKGLPVLLAEATATKCNAKATQRQIGLDCVPA